MDRFTLTIELGNDAAQTPYDVADMLAALAHNLRDPRGDEWGPTTGNMRDVNGNRVGSWEVS